MIGGLVQNVWSYAGSGGTDVNALLVQPFINYKLHDGWYITTTTAPVITANWKADSNNRWTIPVGGGVGKVLRIGAQPVNIQLQTFYNVQRPAGVGEWSIRFQIQLLFPSGGEKHRSSPANSPWNRGVPFAVERNAPTNATGIDHQMEPQAGAMKVGDSWRIRREDMDRRDSREIRGAGDQLPITVQPGIRDAGRLEADIRTKQMDPAFGVGREFDAGSDRAPQASWLQFGEKTDKAGIVRPHRCRGIEGRVVERTEP